MKFSLLFALNIAIGSCAFAEELPATFWGYKQINQTIKARLYMESSSFELHKYLGSAKLSELLGFQPTDLDNGFRNGLPNSTNMLLWSLAFERLSQELGDICEKGSSDSGLTDTAAEAVLQLCRWPDKTAVTPELLESVWLLAMYYDAPEAEFAAWSSFLASRSDSSAAKTFVSNAFFTIFMNPHFLVRK